MSNSRIDVLFQGRRNLPVVARSCFFCIGRDFLCEGRGVIRIGFQRRDDVDPIERVQVIEVDYVVLHHLGEEQDVADDLSVFWNLHAECIFDATNGS